VDFFVLRDFISGLMPFPAFFPNFDPLLLKFSLAAPLYLVGVGQG
jgi:hypothetical protein